MKDPKLNAVAQAVATIPQAPDPAQQANVALLQAQAEVKALRYTAQEITAQRGMAQDQAAEFAARLRIADEEVRALHAALQTAEQKLEALEAERRALQFEVDDLLDLSNDNKPRIAADSIEQPAAIN